MITIKNDNIYIKDLNSRFGTVINDHRFGNSINGVSDMKLRSGVHSLTLVLEVIILNFVLQLTTK